MKTLISAIFEQGLISVKDTLPEKNKKVLCFDWENGYYLARYQAQPGFGDFFFSDVFKVVGGDAFKKYNPEFWTPLPDYPKRIQQ